MSLRDLPVLFRSEYDRFQPVMDHLVHNEFKLVSAAPPTWRCPQCESTTQVTFPNLIGSNHATDCPWLQLWSSFPKSIRSRYLDDWTNIYGVKLRRKIRRTGQQ